MLSQPVYYTLLSLFGISKQDFCYDGSYDVILLALFDFAKLVLFSFCRIMFHQEEIWLLVNIELPCIYSDM